MRVDSNFGLILTSVPNPAKKLSICCRSLSVTSELKFSVSRRNSGTSNDSEFSEVSLDGELWSLIEPSRGR